MRRLHLMTILALLAATLSACGITAPAAPASSGSQPLRKVTLAMSYIPTVQFAPYYVAQAKGYYAQEGLDVTFDYNFENDVIARTAQGTADFAMASGMSVLLARGQDLPVATVMTLYQQFPVVFFSKSSQNIKTVADMRGKSVGLPGR
ncbi:MAG: ABC transporter substrate-binding protein, partial [Chloroflexales bacterium]|nr:ABC transporter substrate-binding protein [Chloroflexales bacterium]